MLTHDRRPAAAAVAMLALASCTQQQLALPTPKCPAVAAQPRDYGPPAVFPGRYSIRMALSVPYVRDLVRSQASLSDTGAFGVNLNTVWVDQRDAPAGRAQLLQAVFTVWRRTQEGTREDMPGRTYTLNLRLQPYLINAQRIPDVGRRAEILCGSRPTCATNGAVIDVAFFSLIKGYPSTPAEERVIDCADTARYDFIDEIVLTEALGLANRLKPLVIPTEGIVDLLGDMLGQNVTLEDVGLAADKLGGLEIGFVMPQGSSPWSGDDVTMRSGQDWEFTVDPGLVTAGVRKKIVDSLAVQQGLSLSSVNVTLEESGIAVSCNGTIDLPLCPATPFTYQIVAQPRMCRRNDMSILRLCTSGPGATPGGCQFLLGLLGRSVAVVSNTGTDPCSQKEMSFDAGDDRFHANRIETGGVFVIGGRSEKMDQLHPERTDPLPACPF